MHICVDLDLTFHKQALERRPNTAKAWAVRGDAVLYSEDGFQYFEDRKTIYAISAAVNKPLREQTSRVAESARKEGQDKDGHVYSIAGIHYTPKTWKTQHSFIINRRLRFNPSS